MIKEDNEISLFQEKLKLSQELWNFNNDDYFQQKKYHFNIDQNHITIFKNAEEPYLKVFLKAMAYYMYLPSFSNLQIDPPPFRRYKGDLISFDYSSEPVCWIQVLERDFAKIEYLCKHLNLKNLILIEISEDLKPLIDDLKKKVHYKFHHLIKIVNFIPELIYYVDPQEVVIIDDWYHLTELSQD